MTSEESTLTPEEKVQFCEDFVQEVMNEGNLDAADEFFAEDYVEHNTVQPEPVRGREEIKEMYEEISSAAPDMTVTIQETVVQGDLVAVRYVNRGTHTGEFKGIGPSGKEIEIVGKDFYRFEGEKVVEGWVQIDAVGMLQQTGIIPEGALSGDLGIRGIVTHFVKRLVS